MPEPHPGPHPGPQPGPQPGPTGEPAARVRDSFDRQALMQTFGARLDHCAPGLCQISAPILPIATQQHGAGHAALCFALGDSAAGYAALSLMPAGQEVMTVEMKINLLSPAVGDRLVARGRVVRAGRRLSVVTCEVSALSAAGEKTVALLQGTMIAVAPAR
jgi:uncharacterized protein (TIGR00369 family)